jgi:cytochrome b
MGRERIYESDAARQAAWKARNPEKVARARRMARLRANPDTAAMLHAVLTAMLDLRQASELLKTRASSWDARGQARDLVDQAAGTLSGWLGE